MTDGRRWLALDADLFGKRFTDDLYRQFGWAGVVTWVAFLCACKRSRHPGRISALNENDAAHILGIADWDLADNDGKPWTLEEFWAFTGRKKQTRRTRHDRRFDVISTHWDRWQFAAGKSREAERMRRSRADKRSRGSGRATDRARTSVGPDVDPDCDTPLAPPGGDGMTSSSNGQVKTEDLIDLGTAVGELKAAMRGDDG